MPGENSGTPGKVFIDASKANWISAPGADGVMSPISPVAFSAFGGGRQTGFTLKPTHLRPNINYAY